MRRLRTEIPIATNLRSVVLRDDQQNVRLRSFNNRREQNHKHRPYVNN